MSPVLANIYAHYIIDLWFKKVVPQHINGDATIIRYCDDFIICCTDTRDVAKVKRSLDKRLNKFGLKLNTEKTKTVKFNKWYFDQGEKQESFDFLGFTFFLAKARHGGHTTVKVKTSKKTLREKLFNVNQWLRLNRAKGHLLSLWLKFCRKLQGHVVYFGVTDNQKNVQRFLHQARRLFFKWINRRSQKRSLNWSNFTQFEKQYPKPYVKVYHPIYH